MPGKQTENDQWHEQTPANPATQQMAELHETKKKWCQLMVQNIEKVFLSGFKKISRNRFYNGNERKPKKLVHIIFILFPSFHGLR